MIATLNWLDAGIFPVTVLISYNFDYDELIKLLKQKRATDWYNGLSDDKELIDNGNYFGLYRTFNEKKLFYIILTEEFKFTDYEYCKLAHEVLHICQFMLQDILDRDREYECEAYLHTHLMNQCLKTIRKSK
jgi:hypothetical protein